MGFRQKRPGFGLEDGLEVLALGFLLLLLISALLAAGTGGTGAMETLAQETSPDGAWILTIRGSGEPDWPFGKEHLQVRLWEEAGKETGQNYRVEFEADVSRGGAAAGWDIRWLERGVEVTLHGEDPPDAVYVLPFPDMETS